MPANTLDHRVWAQENFSDVAAGLLSAVLTANPALDFAAPTGVTTTAGAGAGTTPPATVILAGSNALRGNLTFGTGSATPAGGIVYNVVFPVAITLNGAGVLPFIFLQATTQATAAFGFAAVPTISAGTCTGFAVRTTGTLTASQGNTVYGLNWLVIAQ